MKRHISLLLTLLVALFVMACNSTVPESPADEPAPTEEATTPADETHSSEDISEPGGVDLEQPTPNPEPEQRDTTDMQMEPANVFIDSMDVMLMESFPMQAQAVIRGSVPDGCTQVRDANVTRDGNTFNVQVNAFRPADMMCTQALEPFELTVPLEIQGLEAGTYIVSSNEIAAKFDLEVDNVSPDNDSDEENLIPGQYIVMFADDVFDEDGRTAAGISRRALAQQLVDQFDANLLYVYDVTNGFSLNGLSEEQARELAAMPEIKLVEQDSVQELQDPNN